MKIIFLLIPFLLVTLFATAQNKALELRDSAGPAGRYTISGFIKDSLNGETLIGATITVKGQTKGISSNQYGFYSITLNAGNYLLACSYIGYQPKLVEIKLDHDRQFNFEVLPQVILSEEVVVTTKKKRCQC